MRKIAIIDMIQGAGWTFTDKAEAARRLNISVDTLRKYLPYYKDNHYLVVECEDYKTMRGPKKKKQ